MSERTIVAKLPNRYAKTFLNFLEYLLISVQNDSYVIHSLLIVQNHFDSHPFKTDFKPQPEMTTFSDTKISWCQEAYIYLLKKFLWFFLFTKHLLIFKNFIPSHNFIVRITLGVVRMLKNYQTVSSSVICCDRSGPSSFTAVTNHESSV